jgi:hypothetical protein
LVDFLKANRVLANNGGKDQGRKSSEEDAELLREQLCFNRQVMTTSRSNELGKATNKSAIQNKSKVIVIDV